MLKRTEARIVAAICTLLSGRSAGTLAARAPAAPVQTPAAVGQTSQPQRTLLIVHPPALRDAAHEWRDYRAARGWNAVIAEAPAPAAAQDHADAIEASRQAIRGSIRAACAQAHPASPADFAVLLLGDDDAIPGWHFPQTDPLLTSEEDREYISDQPYQFGDDADRMPDYPLGRVPARSNDEARALLHKIQQHEQAASGAQPHAGADPDVGSRITYVAGEGHFGPLDPLLESLFIMMVDRFVPDAFNLSMTYAKPSSIYCPPPSQLTPTVFQRMTEGGVLFNYVGHGWEQGLDSLHWRGKRFPLLRTSDMRAAVSSRAPQRPVAFMSCCSVGHFDLPGGAHCLAEEMLFFSAGPIAVIAGSRITHPYANTILQKDITHALLIDRAPTAGLLDLLAERSLLTQDAEDRELDMIAGAIARTQKWATSLRDLRIMHARMYNLLGARTTELSLPAMNVKRLAVKDGIVSGRIDGMASGRVTIEIETPRIEIAHPERLLAIAGDDDSDLERKAANNYPIANDRLLLKIEGEVKDGAFAVTLPGAGGLPERAGVVRVSAAGVDAAGKPMESIGALRLKQSTATMPVIPIPASQPQTK